MAVFRKQKSHHSVLIALPRLALAAAVFFVPLFFLPGLTDALELPKGVLMMALTLLAAAALAAEWVLRGEVRWKRVPAGWWLAGLTALVLLSSVFSVHRPASLFGVTGFVHQTLPMLLTFILFVVVATQVLDGERDVRFFVQVLTVALGLAALIGVLQMSGASPWPWSELRQPSFLVTGNSAVTFALLMAILIPLALTFLRTARSMIWRILGYGALVLPILGLLAVDAPAAWIGLMVALIVALVFASLQPFSQTELVASVVLLAVAVAGLLLPTGQWLGTKVNADLRLDAGTAWTVTKGTLAKYPILGSGPSTFLYDFVAHRPASFNDSPFAQFRFMKASDDVTQLLATAGVLGVLVLLAMVVSVFLALMRRSQQLSRQQREGWRTSAAVFGAWCGLLASLFFVPSTLASFALFWMLMGLVFVLIRPTGADRSLKETAGRLSSTVGFLAVTLIFLAVVVSSVRLLLADRAYAQATAAIRQTQNIDSVIQGFDRALRFNPANPNAYLLRAQAKVVKAQLLRQSSDQAVSEVQSVLVSAADDGEQAAARDPKNPVILESLAELYQSMAAMIDDASDRMIGAYQRLVAADPSNARAHVNLGQTHYFVAAAIKDDKDQAAELQKNAVAARAEFTAALRLQAENVDASFGLVLVDELVGENDAAFDRLLALTQANPASAGLEHELGLRYAAKDDRAKARQAFTRVVELQPGFADAHWQLGLLAEKDQDTATARKEFELVQQLDPSNTEVTKKLEALPKT